MITGVGIAFIVTAFWVAAAEQVVAVIVSVTSTVPAPAAPQVTATNAPQPTPAPQEKAQPEFRLSAIIYTVARPSAIVNRETVHVGDHVSGATVVAIDRTQVTLQINGQRKTCVLE